MAETIFVVVVVVVVAIWNSMDLQLKVNHSINEVHAAREKHGRTCYLYISSN